MYCIMVADLQHLEPIHLSALPTAASISEQVAIAILISSNRASIISFIIQDLRLRVAKRELEELKDVHKKMYTFIMDILIP